MKFSSFILLLLSFSAIALFAGPYEIETVALPKGVPAEVGALAFNSKGELVVALRRSDVFIAKPTTDPAKFVWRRFASGLHNACGIQIISPDEILISQMPELTRIADTNGDGRADLYENASSAWGMSGNYHETNHMTSDGEGGWFLAIGTASHNGPVFNHVRGKYSKVGRRGRNFSAASWKGWILHVDVEGEMTPWASGFRMHNGIFRDSRGLLWSGDNQGDWKATTPFYRVEKGNFYGHVSSLIWDPKWDASIDPLDLSIEKIDALKTPAAILLPHSELNRSASEPIEIPADTFGPYGGQILLPDNNGKRISRLMLEKVDGQYQGAATHFYNESGLNMGNNRVRFSPDGSTLYIGQTSRGWGPIAEGVQRIKWTGEVPFDVLAMTLTPTGFRFTFTKPIDAKTLTSVSIAARSYHYQDTGSYGGDQLDVIKETPKDIRFIDKKTVELDIADLKDGGYVYEMILSGIKSTTGDPLRSEFFCYTVNRLKKP